MIIPHHLNPPILGKRISKDIPPPPSIRYWLLLATLQKTPLFLVFSGNLPETTAKKYPSFPRKWERACDPPYAFEWGARGYFSVFCLHHFEISEFHDKGSKVIYIHELQLVFSIWINKSLSIKVWEDKFTCVDDWCRSSLERSCLCKNSGKSVFLLSFNTQKQFVNQYVQVLESNTCTQLPLKAFFFFSTNVTQFKFEIRQLHSA